MGASRTNGGLGAAAHFRARPSLTFWAGNTNVRGGRGPCLLLYEDFKSLIKEETESRETVIELRS